MRRSAQACGGGHGVGSTRDQENALLADVLAFLLHTSGLDDPD
jgi:hypothetical protein